MLKGTYVFKQDGIEIGRSNNIITTNGTRAILQHLTGSTLEWAASISVGAINTTPTTSDLSLKYEMARSPVTLKSYIPGTPNLIVVKGTIAANVVGNIYEVGVFPQNTAQIFGGRDQLIIDDFSILPSWYINGESTIANSTLYNTFAAQSPYSPRIGAHSINLPANSTLASYNQSISLSKYSSLDTLDLLVNVPVGSSGGLTISLTDVNGVSAYFYEYIFGSVTGYQVISMQLPSNISTLSTISTIQISTIGTNSSIVVDAVRVSVLSEIGANTGIVSRSVLTSPIAKIYGVPLDLEYYLQIS